MGVNVPNTPAIQAVVFNERQNITIHGLAGLRLLLQLSNKFAPISQVAKSQFANDKRMEVDLLLFQQAPKHRLWIAQMFNPN